MSIARCDDHSPRSRKYQYKARAIPKGYPDTAVVCGMPGCSQPALIWLSPDEHAAFESGERTFYINPRVLKLRVTDDPPSLVTQPTLK